jgi:riboflavin kinase/FMN adenylyltransferase
MGEKYNFSVSELPKVTIGGLTVSSSNIRNALLNGEVENASNMLGYPYTLQGRVVKGNKIGSNIGFPTANLKPDDPHKLTPGQGVYATKVMVNELIYNSMTNIGFRPTIDADHLTIETHIFDFNQDIYDSRIDLSFVARIRNEKRFTSLGNLQLQLAVDSVIAHKLLGMK